MLAGLDTEGVQAGGGSRVTGNTIAFLGTYTDLSVVGVVRGGRPFAVGWGGRGEGGVLVTVHGRSLWKGGLDGGCDPWVVLVSGAGRKPNTS